MASLYSLRGDLRTWTATHANAAVLPDPICDECVNSAIAVMAEAHLWRGQETTSIPLTYPATAESLPLPPDFVTHKAVYAQSSSGPPQQLGYIERTLRDEWVRSETPAGGVRDPDYPQVAPAGGSEMAGVQYAIWQECLYLLPIPSSDVSLVLDYFARPAPLTLADDHNFFTDRYLHVVRIGALADAYAYLHEDERSMAYRALFESWLTRTILDDKTTVLAGGTRSRGV